MAYQVIARKYRPQRFAAVVGQDHVTQTLTQAILQQRIAHAYLFVGPRGTGKTTIARIFAKCLNCQDGPRVDFADDDPRCQEISEGRSLDVLEIDGASNRGIDEVRELRETVKYAPAVSRFKIYIVDEVHMLTKEAFNALLKTLEEPPAHVKFLFATTEPEKVLPTILSRCQRFDLRRIPTTLIVRHLAHIARLEKVTVDDLALHAIARGADGCLRDAESALDQLISFCGNQIAEADVLSMFGLTARSQIHALASHILRGEIDPALRAVDEFGRNGKDLGRLLSDLVHHFRNLLVYQVGRGDLSLLEAGEAEAAVVAQQAAQTPEDALFRVMEVLADGEGRLREAGSKNLALELALFKAIQARNATSIDALLAQLRALRDRQDINPVPAPANPSDAKPPSSPGPTPRRASAPPSAAPARSAPDGQLAQITPPPAPSLAPNAAQPELAALWAKVVDAVGRASPFVRTYLLQAQPVSLDNQAFTIGFDPEFADNLELVNNAKNRALIQTKLHELGHGTLTIRFVTAPAPAFQPPPPAATVSSTGQPQTTRSKPEGPLSASAAVDEFRNDPLIRRALEVFKGQIVEVRG